MPSPRASRPRCGPAPLPPATPPGCGFGVLALQGDVAEHLRALADTGARAVAVRRAEELGRVDGLVIPGGESTTMSRLSVAFDMLEPLRKLIGCRAARLRVLRGDDHAGRPARSTARLAS